MRLHRNLIAILSLQLFTRGYSLQCFITPADPTGSSSRRSPVPTTFHACFPVVKFLAQHERIDLPLDFSRQPGAGYRVPAQWANGNCVVIIDVQSNDDVATTSFNEIAHEAGVVLLGCVVQPPHLGGSQWVGERQVMKVSVFGARRFAPGTSAPSLLSAKFPAMNISDSESSDTA
ncbi:MAG: hypothetical protein Q9191_006734 [Dirinaria sp. TL-2023a]